MQRMRHDSYVAFRHHNNEMIVRRQCDYIVPSMTFQP